jgi:hypothetical protein
MRACSAQFARRNAVPSQASAADLIFFSSARIAAMSLTDACFSASSTSNGSIASLRRMASATDAASWSTASIELPSRTRGDW